MGCPTANLIGFPAGKIVPRDGIYAAIAEIEGVCLSGGGVDRL